MVTCEHVYATTPPWRCVKCGTTLPTPFAPEPKDIVEAALTSGRMVIIPVR